MVSDVACYCSKIRRGSRRLMRIYDEALAPAGLTVMQFAAMRTIAQLGVTSLSGLADATGHDRTTMWRILQPLTRNGWVQSGGAARKATAVTLTDLGRDRLALAEPHWRDVQARVEAALGPHADGLFAALEGIEALAV